MWNNTDKTVPYRPSPSELENLRLLRKRTNPSGTFKDDEENDEVAEENDIWQSALSQATLKVIRCAQVSNDENDKSAI